MKKSTEPKVGPTVHTINGHTFPVLGVLHIEWNPIPLLNIRMMSDERERELARKGAAV